MSAPSVRLATLSLANASQWARADALRNAIPIARSREATGDVGFFGIEFGQEPGRASPRAEQADDRLEVFRFLIAAGQD